MRYATYFTTEAIGGKGMYFFPSCCKYWIYSVRDEMAYHGKFCPRCFCEKNRKTILYKQGTEEAELYCADRSDNE